MLIIIIDDDGMKDVQNSIVVPTLNINEQYTKEQEEENHPKEQEDEHHLKEPRISEPQHETDFHQERKSPKQTPQQQTTAEQLKKLTDDELKEEQQEIMDQVQIQEIEQNTLQHPYKPMKQQQQITQYIQRAEGKNSKRKRKYTCMTITNMYHTT